MTSETAMPPATGHENRRLTALAWLAVGVVFFALWFWPLPQWLRYSLWFWLLPQWLRFSVAAASQAPWRWIAALPSVLGFSVVMRCVCDFGWTGRGTPAPIAPPKNLVVVGLYRYVRNPMYLGFATGWIGLWVVFSHAAPLLMLAVAAFAIGVHLFVVSYEEPTLRKKFGGAYIKYCRNVRRWRPRLSAWHQ